MEISNGLDRIYLNAESNDSVSIYIIRYHHRNHFFGSFINLDFDLETIELCLKCKMINNILYDFNTESCPSGIKLTLSVLKDVENNTDRIDSVFILNEINESDVEDNMKYHPNSNFSFLSHKLEKQENRLIQKIEDLNQKIISFENTVQKLLDKIEKIA